MLQKIIIFVLVIGIVVLGISLFKKSSEVSDISKILNQQQDSTHHWIDEYGKEHAYSQSIVLSSEEVGVVYKKKLDSVAKELKISKNNIKSISTETSTTLVNKDFSKVDTVYKFNGDSTRSRVISSLSSEFSDNWLNLKVTLGDSRGFKLKLKDTASSVVYTKGFFNPKYYQDIKHSSPYTRSDSIKNILIKDPSPKFSIGLIGGYGYSLKNPSLTPIFGIGVTYRIISFGK